MGNTANNHANADHPGPGDAGGRKHKSGLVAMDSRIETGPGPRTDAAGFCNLARIGTKLLKVAG